ncbi:MAG: OmpA family protein [Bacteroidales bacterium]|nr:OmpA family protein [Bacteroidales bacterium]
MRFKIIIIIQFCFCFCEAQNLVPNPGFEAHIKDSVYDWRQPIRPWYHFENNSSKAHSGECYNGICMWKWNTTEYLQVKLKSRLSENQNYLVKAYLLTVDSLGKCDIDSLNEIGFAFTTTPLKVDRKTRFFIEPQIKFKPINNYTWYKLEEKFVAKGNEEYLLIGRFYKTKNKSRIDTLESPNNKVFFEQLNEIEIKFADSVKKVENEVKSKYKDFLDNSWDIQKIKNKKKREAKNEKFRIVNQKLQQEISIRKYLIYDYFKQKEKEIIEGFKQKNKDFPDLNCRLRFYIDDISVEPVEESKFSTVKGKVTVLKNVFFDFDKYDLLPQSFAELNKLVSFLNENPSIEIEISGHTDIVGSESYNISLSEARAKSVVNFLISKGINPERLVYTGYGTSVPVADNNSTEGRAKNRRVEFKILKTN